MLLLINEYFIHSFSTDLCHAAMVNTSSSCSAAASQADKTGSHFTSAKSTNSKKQKRSHPAIAEVSGWKKVLGPASQNDFDESLDEF